SPQLSEADDTRAKGRRVDQSAAPSCVAPQQRERRSAMAPCRAASSDAPPDDTRRNPLGRIVRRSAGVVRTDRTWNVRRDRDDRRFRTSILPSEDLGCSKAASANQPRNPAALTPLGYTPPPRVAFCRARAPAFRGPPCLPQARPDQSFPPLPGSQDHRSQPRTLWHRSRQSPPAWRAARQATSPPG